MYTRKSIKDCYIQNVLWCAFTILKNPRVSFTIYSPEDSLDQKGHGVAFVDVVVQKQMEAIFWQEPVGQCSIQRQRISHPKLLLCRSNEWEYDWVIPLVPSKYHQFGERDTQGHFFCSPSKVLRQERLISHNQIFDFIGARALSNSSRISLYQCFDSQIQGCWVMIL